MLLANTLFLKLSIFVCYYIGAFSLVDLIMILLVGLNCI